MLTHANTLLRKGITQLVVNGLHFYQMLQTVATPSLSAQLVGLMVIKSQTSCIFESSPDSNIPGNSISQFKAIVCQN